MKISQEIEQQLTKQAPEAQTQLRNSKAMVCLALSMGATTTLLPEQAVANSLLSYVNNEQTFSLDKQPKSPTYTSKSIALAKKPKQLTSSSSPIKVNKPQKIKEHIHGIIPCMLDSWAHPFERLFLLKSSMVYR